MTYTPPKPQPDGNDRHQNSSDIRKNAATNVSRKPITTTSNGEAGKYHDTWPTNFSKGLPHNGRGIVDPNAFELFFENINAEKTHHFEVPLGPCAAEKNYRPDDYSENVDIETFLTDTSIETRGWESPRAGHVYDLEGPDAGSVGMAPAPTLGSDELAAEMAEDYAMALLRDTPFEDIRQGHGDATQIVNALNKLPWFNLKSGNATDTRDDALSVFAKRRQRAKFANTDKQLTCQSIFRGSSRGCMDGPYLSQFLLIGNAARNANAKQALDKGYNTPTSFNRAVKVSESENTWEYHKNKSDDGYIIYGAQRVDQRVGAHKIGVDHMTDWATWLDAQNGADFRGQDKYEEGLRFLTTPRDLATYVHFDALYQAYLNACLFLLAIDAKTDSGFPEGNDINTRSAFATFGGPHVLTLVTETATRSLKAVRRQKYNYHLRARPEVVAGVTSLAASSHRNELKAAAADAAAHLSKLQSASTGSYSILDAINAHNAAQNNDNAKRQKTDGRLPDIAGKNYLLPMAFPEGSPMHPAYGAGHATVAGSCVTMLKAFFELFTTADGWEPIKLSDVGKEKPISSVYIPSRDGKKLEEAQDKASDLTLVGELNKLAANISIGRNMAGVHYYSDYYDSLRMGERIAIGMLEEQMATYSEEVSMRLTSFDDDCITLWTDGEKTVTLDIKDSNGTPVDSNAWFQRHVKETT